METTRLKQFHTLYQTKNLRRASELLGITHSGLSKSMSRLEEELGIALYHQVGRTIAFSDEAHELAQKIPDFLKSLEGLIHSTQAGHNILKIGSFEVFTTYFTKILAPIFNDYELDYHELVPGRMERALASRDIDLAITYEPIALSGIEHIKASEIEMAPFVRKGAFKGRDILDIPFAAPLIPIEGAPTGMKGLDSWPDHDFKRVINYRVDLMETAISLAREGLCAVFLPTFVAKLHNDVVKSEFQLVRKSLPAGMKPVRRSVYIVKRESTVEDARVRKLAKFLRTIKS